MIKLTGYGRREWLGGGIIAMVLLAVCALICMKDLTVGLALGFIVILVWGGVAAFFRDPERKVPDAPNVIVSPADGVVKDIELIPNADCGSEELGKLFAGKDMLRIGIFLSVFDVHLNRAPSSMKVKFKYYKKGAFHDARDGRASKENESMLIGCEGTVQGLRFPLAVKQISGAIARRIVCPVEPEDTFEKGERYGMIKFGSRTELYLPVKSNFEISVKVGDKVFGGSTVMAVITKPSTQSDIG